MQIVGNGFNTLKMNGSTHVHMLIIEEIWKKSLIHFNINVGFLIVTCVLINYHKCKMQFLNNDFNMLKLMVQLMYHVNSWKNVKKIINPL
jgi:hypothetical protein